MFDTTLHENALRLQVLHEQQTAEMLAAFDRMSETNAAILAELDRLMGG